MKVRLLILLIPALMLLAWITVTNPLVRRQRSAVPVVAKTESLATRVKRLTEFSRGADHPTGLNDAKHYLEHEWSKLNLTLTRQSFAVDKKPYSNLSVSFGPPNADVIIVGAHYDSFKGQPGADDNASGVAALLELSEMLALYNKSLPHRIELVAYTLEEPPYFGTSSMGSLMHARATAQRRTPVRAMINLEMIGFFSDAPRSQSFPLAMMKLFYPERGNFLAIVGNLQSWLLVRKIKAAIGNFTDLPVFSFNAPASVEGVDYSDQQSYWAYHFPAAMLTDTAHFRNHAYHTPSDTAETLNFDKLAQVVEGVFGYLITP